MEVNTLTGELIKIDLDPERLVMEEEVIYSFLSDIELDYQEMTWNGHTLKVKYSDGRVTESPRAELEEYIDELDISSFISDDDDFDTHWTGNSFNRNWTKKDFLSIF